jgi:hypothetical protein
MISGQSSLLFGLLKTGNEFYRAAFMSAALSRGVYENFIDGKASLEQLCEKIAVSNREGLRPGSNWVSAWANSNGQGMSTKSRAKFQRHCSNQKMMPTEPC